MGRKCGSAGLQQVKGGAGCGSPHWLGGYQRCEGRKEDANDSGVMDEVLESESDCDRNQSYPHWASHPSVNNR